MINLIIQLPIPIVGKLSRTCRRFYTLIDGINLFRIHTRHRFRVDVIHHDLRLKYEPMENNWNQFYERLDNTCTGFQGFCMDSATNNFFPYPLELVIQTSSNSIMTGFLPEALAKECSGIDGLNNLRVCNLEGFCRWRTLMDSLTKVSGTIIDTNKVSGARFLIDPWTKRPIIRHIILEETDIIRGDNLAVPNRYYGCIDGHVVIGMYDPGEMSSLGVFCLVMEDSITIPQRSLSFYAGKQYFGLEVIACSTRLIRNCVLTVEFVQESHLDDGYNISGIFAINKHPCLSSCRLDTNYPDWHSVRFTAFQPFNPTNNAIPITRISFLGDSHPLIPNNSIPMYRKGDVLIGMFNSPSLGAFYLMEL
ncbi:hypothetical protein BC833DRAFT_582491 [Globomyces pollinis-pini]|nr:hypothetical protein BC833DRAFT_582491 [Globomyces pollinis-pini]